MPKIPEFFVPSVEESPVRMPQAQGQQIAPYQPVQLEQLSKLSEAMEAAGTGLSRAYAVIQDDENDAIAKDMDIQLKIKLDDMLENPQNGFLMATGPNAGLDQYHKIVQDASKIIEDSFSDFKEGGKYERSYYQTAHGMYKGVAMQRLDTFKTRAAEHARSNIKEYASKMSEARWMMSSDDAAKRRNGWETKGSSFHEALISARTEAGNIAARTAGNDSTSPEYQAIFKVKMGQTHSAVITNFLIGDNPNVTSAQKYLNAYGDEMMEQDRGKLQEAIRDRAPIAEGFKAFRAVMADKTLTDVNQRRERLNQMFEKNEGLTTTKGLDDAIQRLNNQERYDEKDRDVARAETWLELTKYLDAPENSGVKTVQDIARKDPAIAAKIEQYGLTDNAARILSGQETRTSEEVETKFTMQDANQLAANYPREEDLRRALAGRASPSFVEATVHRWASVSKNASKEQALAGKSYMTVESMAEVSLEKQNVWAFIPTGKSGEPTKRSVIIKYGLEAERRAKAKKANGEQITEQDVLNEMKLMEQSSFRAFKDGYFWDSDEKTIGSYGFYEWLSSGAARKATSVDTLRYTPPSGDTVELKLKNVLAPVTVNWPENTAIIGKKTYESKYEALLDLNKFAASKGRPPFDLETESGFFDAYMALDKLLGN